MHHPLAEARQLREQLSSDKRRFGCLFGAGTSQAVGLDGIIQLTSTVGDNLPAEIRPLYTFLLTESGDGGTVEHVLNKVRLYRELLKDAPALEINGIDEAKAALLDREICHAIYKRVCIDPPRGLQPYVDFASWIASVSRRNPVEIFTTNYDLLIERGLEAVQVPHFDGFVGTYEPHFLNACVEGEPGSIHESVYPPRGFARVWKLHGSIGWRLTQPNERQSRIIRVPQRNPNPADELLIYPSRQKYADSRKQPYVAYHDRLRRFVLSGEAILIVAGYSFGDEHINEIIFEGLRLNNRLAVTVLLFGNLNDDVRAALIEPHLNHKNLTVYAADRALVAGSLAPWTTPKPEQMSECAAFWDGDNTRFKLGDFQAFAKFLVTYFGPEHYETDLAGPVVGTTVAVEAEYSSAEMVAA